MVLRVGQEASLEEQEEVLREEGLSLVVAAGGAAAAAVVAAFALVQREEGVGSVREQPDCHQGVPGPRRQTDLSLCTPPPPPPPPLQEQTGLHTHITTV